MAPLDLPTERCEGSEFMPLAPKLISRRARAALSLGDLAEGMIVRYLSVAPPDVVFVKGILEASEGVAGMFAERGGELALIAPHDQATELGELLTDLVRDLGATVSNPDESASRID